MKVLVTGAAGRLGRFAVPALLGRGHELRLCVQNAEDAKEAFPKLNVEIMQLDFLGAQDPAFETIVKGMDAVVHLAGLISYEERDREKIFAINAEATKKLALASKKAGVKKFVFVSSTAIYHEPKKQPIGEGEEPSPTNDYGRSKLLAEKHLRESGVPFVILRPTLIYGPGFEEGFFAISRLIKQGAMPVIGSGRDLVALVHAQDVAEAVALALEKEGALGQDFNLSAQSVTERELLDALAEELDVPAPWLKLPAFLAYAFAGMGFLQKLVFKKRVLYPDYVRTFTASREFDCSKARNLLGWSPRVDARDGISEVVSSFVSRL